MSGYHVPVLASESLELLDIKPDGTYADLTYGGGGHSRAILERLGPNGRLYSFDQDPDARANLPDDNRINFIEGNFRFLRGYLRLNGVLEVDGILADLGVSSHHFDTPERGFSFRFDSPLDMRMNNRSGRTAADVLATYDKMRLSAIFREYGELQGAGRIADAVIHARSAEPVSTVGDLRQALGSIIPRNDESKFLSKLYQALRIEVNRETDALAMALEQSLKVLKPGGRLVVISYHSLEDRLVKNFMRSGNTAGTVEKDFFGNLSTPFELLTRKAMVPTEEEIARNPRSRSAKLRAAIKKPQV